MRTSRKQSQQSAQLSLPKQQQLRKATHRLSTIEHSHFKINPHRLCTEPLINDDHWQFIESRRQNHLNSLFNRRKTLLQTISRKNKDIYQRILKQQSHYQRQKLLPHNQEKTPLLEAMTNGSKNLLAISRQALIQWKQQPVASAVRDDKNNEKEIKKQIAQDASKKLSIQKENTLTVKSQQPVGKIIESRLISHFTSRMHNPLSEQLGSGKSRACSVGRRRLQDVFLNF